jgi:hypothetical protein
MDSETNRQCHLSQNEITQCLYMIKCPQSCQGRPCCGLAGRCSGILLKILEMYIPSFTHAIYIITVFTSLDSEIGCRVHMVSAWFRYWAVLCQAMGCYKFDLLIMVFISMCRRLYHALLSTTCDIRAIAHRFAKDGHNKLCRSWVFVPLGWLI